MTELYHLSLSEAACLIATQELSPVELTRAFLDRIDRLNDTLHAFLLVTPERALAAAMQAETEISQGNYRGALHGIPIGVKDVFDTAGIPTTAQSRLLQDRIPTQDATVVRRLYQAGAILLGKLATKEFAGGGPSFDLYYPPARNPWNLDHVTGDSSTGSGAGVAAGLCMAALGSDTSGSIREPSAFCGLVGFKPTYGRVSCAGMIPQSPSLDHAGPMTWTVRDNALLLQAIAGYDANDPASAAVAVPDFTAQLEAGLEHRRIGIVRHFYDRDGRADPEVCAALDQAYMTLGELGAQLVEVELPPLAEFIACCQIIMLSEAFTLHEQDLRQRPHLYGEGLRGLLLMGAFISAADYLQAVRRRRELCFEVEQALKNVDVLVTATEFRAAPPIVKTRQLDEAISSDPLMPFSVTGLPALAVCCGFNQKGLPLSMQIIGKPFDEATVLAVGNAYEQATPWREFRPELIVEQE
ncbi:amidase [Planktothrix agardhii]|jgi:aspartyl-tRNA(Asn)/glutamyl-tRNA(Gln) amidotransferase subunit A|uniref:amidase n=1 Tax=Planktothrix agardhii TaxID=1160 RepID=UPI0020B1B660|nr:amidase [Planktothrix agardhii]MEA5563556.1 amidase [Planktothrix agardhii UHCC 0887]CAD5983312.1 Putative amidase AmiD [Planktothrix agardhii]